MLGAAPHRTRWFHGDTSPRVSFDDQVWDRDLSTSSPLEFGPGLYFTTDLEQARSYGPYVFEATVPDPKSFQLVPHSRPSLRELQRFFKLANEDDQEIFVSNWPDLNATEALRKYTHQTTRYDALVSLYGDLHRDPRDWVEAMRGLGYDGVVVDPRKQSGARYLIVWSPQRVRLTRI